MSRVAAIDCGTNSIRLLVTDLPDRGSDDLEPKHDLVREMRIVRLGYGVDRTGRLDEEALARTFEASDEYAGLARRHGVDAVRFCATSATRDAENAAVFGDGVRERFGVSPDVLTGDEEAALSFAGAVRELPDVDPPVLVVDLGGGSTELIVG
ncbi:MAG: Ppx/GppA phosphatase family protein, partial [Nocardioidaceae bacterium]